MINRIVPPTTQAIACWCMVCVWLWNANTLGVEAFSSLSKLRTSSPFSSSSSSSASALFFQSPVSNYKSSVFPQNATDAFSSSSSSSSSSIVRSRRGMATRPSSSTTIRPSSSKTSTSVYSTIVDTSTYIAQPAPHPQTHPTKRILPSLLKHGNIFRTMDDITKARVLLLSSAALYGTNFSLVKYMGELDTISVGLSTTLRFGLAAFIFWIPLLLSSSSSTSTSREDTTTAATLAGMEVGFYNSIGYMAQAIGLETTSASESAFLCSMAVVIVPLLDYVWDKENKTILPKQIIGIVLAILGVAFLEFAPDSAGVLAESRSDAVVASTCFSLQDYVSNLSFGNICTLIQPLVFGFGFWKMERSMTKYPDSATRITAGQLLAIFLGSAVYFLSTTAFGSSGDGDALVSDIVQQLEQLDIRNNPMILTNLIWTGIITTGLTIYMETIALKTLSAQETTLIFCTEPLWGTAFAIALMGEQQLSLPATVGAICILFGCLYSNMGGKAIVQRFGLLQEGTDNNNDGFPLANSLENI